MRTHSYYVVWRERPKWARMFQESRNRTRTQSETTLNRGVVAIPATSAAHDRSVPTYKPFYHNHTHGLENYRSLFKSLLPTPPRQSNDAHKELKDGEVWLMYGRGPVFVPPEQAQASSTRRAIKSRGSSETADESDKWRWMPLDDQ